jgi:hypothetical protein
MWAITLTYQEQRDEFALIDLSSQLQRTDTSVAALPGHGFTVSTYEEGDDPIKAADSARDAVRPYVSTDPIEIQVMPEAAFAARALAPTVPEIVSAVEAAEILGVSRQRVHQLEDKHPRFPAPLYRLRTGPLWTRAAIEWFDSTWERKPGRPAKPETEVA